MQFHRIPTIIATLAAAATLVLSAVPASASSAQPAQSAQPGVHNSPALPSLTYATNAWWVSGQYGATLRIMPSGIARVMGISAAQGVMNNALEIAGMPPYSPAVYNSLMEQLECHLFLAIKRPTTSTHGGQASHGLLSSRTSVTPGIPA